MNFNKLSLFFSIYVCSIVPLNLDIGKNTGHLDAHSNWLAVEEKSDEVNADDDMHLTDLSKRKRLHIAQLEHLSSVDDADGQKLKKILNSWETSLYFFSVTENSYETLKQRAIQKIDDTKLFIETGNGEQVALTHAEYNDLHSGYIDIFFDTVATSCVHIDYFDSAASCRDFLDKLKTQQYDAENDEEVFQFLKMVDYLAVPFGQIQRYIKSIIFKKPLLLYHIFKDRKVRGDGSEKFLEAELLKIMPYSKKRLGVINNNHPAYGHLDWITSVIALDTNTVVSVADDHTVIVWQRNDQDDWVLSQRLGNLRNLDPLIGHTNFVKSVAVVDSCTIVTASDDHTAIVWHKADDGVWHLQQRLGENKGHNRELGHINSVKSVAVLDDRTIITAAHDRMVIIWQKNAEGVWHLYQQLGEPHNDDPLIGHIFSITGIGVIDSATFVTTSLDRTAIIWHRSDQGEWIFQQRLGSIRSQDPFVGHTHSVTSLAIVDAFTFATASDDQTAIVWQKRADGQWFFAQRIGALDNQDSVVGHKSFIKSIAANGSAMIVTGAFDNSIIVWHKDENGYWAPMHHLGAAHNDHSDAGYVDVVLSVATFKNNMIISGSWDKTVIVWYRDSVENYFESLRQDDGVSTYQKMLNLAYRSSVSKFALASAQKSKELVSNYCAIM